MSLLHEPITSAPALEQRVVALRPAGDSPGDLVVLRSPEWVIRVSTHEADLIRVSGLSVHEPDEVLVTPAAGSAAATPSYESFADLLDEVAGEGASLWEPDVSEVATERARVVEALALTQLEAAARGSSC